MGLFGGDGSGGSFGGAISNFGGVAGGLFGTGQDAGLLGVGQFKAKPVKINEESFGDKESEQRQRDFSAALRQSQNRIAPSMQAANVGQAQTAQAAQIAMAPQSQFRNTQMGLMQALQAQAAGRGPSVAQSQLQAATDRNIAQAMALQASQRGATAGQGLRNVMQATAGANQQAARQAAEIRVQEQLAAQSALAGLSEAGRAQDIGLAQAQAGLQQQAGLANQEAINQFRIQQALLQQQAGQANLDARLQQTGLNDAQSRFFNQGLMQMEDADRQAVMDLEKLKVQQALGIVNANQQGYAAASQARGGLLGNIGSGIAMAASDERLKTDIKDGSQKLTEFVRALSASEYRYKDKKHGEGTYISPMAQELEKTELGKDMVIDTPEGKMVNYARAAGSMLSATAMLNKKVEDLEGRLAQVLSSKRSA